MRPILLTLIRGYLMLAILASLPAGASRSVLCVVPGGHVAIEAGVGRCGDFAPSANGCIANFGASTVSDGCGECADIPIGEHVLSAAREGPRTSDPPSALSIAMHVGFINTDWLGASVPPVVVTTAASRVVAPPTRTTVLRN